jgi:hypothetical protein
MQAMWWHAPSYSSVNPVQVRDSTTDQKRSYSTVSGQKRGYEKTMMSDRKRREAIGQMLYIISATAHYCASRPKNEQNGVLIDALPEMRQLLLQYESQVDAKDE